MRLTKVSSGTLEAIGYDVTTSTVHILFKDNTYYQYKDVPFNVYDGLVKSPSKGSYVYRMAKLYKGLKQ